MTAFHLMGMISTVALTFPIIVLLTTKLAWYRSFPALFFYYLFVLSHNLLLLGYFKMDGNFRYYLAVANNMLDTPLMLTFLIYFSQTAAFRKKLLMIVTGFVAFEIIICTMYGFTSKATTIILAPGLLITLVVSLLFFIHQVKIAVVYHKAAGKAIMAASLLFAYVGYCFVYAVYYLIQPVFKDDAHLVFFLIIICSSTSLAVGIFLERKRVLQLIELQTTRKELKAIYGGQDPKKRANPFEAATFNLDKEQWS
jgi:hypothetical protein